MKGESTPWIHSIIAVDGEVAPFHSSDVFLRVDGDCLGYCNAEYSYKYRR